MALRTPTVIALMVVLSAAVASPPASASRAALRRTGASGGVDGDGSGSIGRVSLHNGNGKRNVNTSSILSPTVNRGGLQIANTNTAGTTITKVNAHKNKFCCSHRHRHRRRR